MDNMQCKHCSREFDDRLQLASHYREHAAIQERLGFNRTYGFQYHSSKPNPSTSRQIEARISLSSLEAGSFPVALPPKTPETKEKSIAEELPAEERLHDVAAGKSHEPDVSHQRLAAVGDMMKQENGLFVVRGFSELNIQYLLHMQMELAQWERDLKSLSDSAIGSESREQLMDRLGNKLDKYNKALLIQSQLRKLKAPEDGFVTALRSWAADSGLTGTPECDFLAEVRDVQRDLVAVDPNADRKVWTHRVVEKLVWRLLVKNPKSGNSVPFQHGGVLYTYDDEIIAKLVRLVLTVIASIILVIPIIILYFINSGRDALIVVTISTVIVAVLAALTTDCKNHEILLAAAAYGAVMIVYVKD